MYDRNYDTQTINVEASGGLANSSLVMQDRETDTYWSIMEGEAIAGELKGNELVELPVSKKIQWKDWVELHPDTLVLSVDGQEDIRVNPYNDYFRDSRGFRGATAKDKRLETKEPIFAFDHQGNKYAVPFEEIEEGRAFELDSGTHIFLYRRNKSELFESTSAYLSNNGGFEKTDGVWVAKNTEARFDTDKAEFVGDFVMVLTGFDTFWYNWSLNNPETEVLK